MKAHHFLAVFLLILSFRFSYSQNDVEKYKLAELIEGSNLTLSTSPFYSNSVYYDTIKYNNLNLGLSADFTKWRFTPKLDYSIHVKPLYRYSRQGVKEFSIDTVFTNSSGDLTIEGGMSYYPLKIAVYGGVFISTLSHYSSTNKPSSNNNLYTYLGYGRLVNAGQVIYAKNFENVLLSEGIISKKLNGQVFRKLTGLLDKRFNREFTARFKDDADIEFFSQIENLLIDEKVINTSLNSRTVLKLFQALTNGNFVNYPRYKGFLAQTEINYNNIHFVGSADNRNILSLIFSGLYGIPIGLKTNLVFSYYVALPLNDQSKEPGYFEIFHSPITLRENFYPYPLLNNYLDRGAEYDYYTGGKIVGFYNLSATAGLSGFFNLNYGKTKGGEGKYAIFSLVNLKYNILSQLYLNAYVEFTDENSTIRRFSSGIDFGYILF
jgi:hypothetical protein